MASSGVGFYSRVENRNWKHGRVPRQSNEEEKPQRRLEGDSTLEALSCGLDAAEKAYGEDFMGRGQGRVSV